MSDPVPLPQARVEHELPGRLRVRVPSRRGDRPYFEVLARRVAGLAGVRRVSADPLTAGVLIEHATGTDAISAFAHEHGLFDLAARAAPPAPAAAPARPCPAVSPDPLSLTSVGLAGAGVYQLTRGQVLGSASENLWGAYGAYTALKQPWLAAALVGFGLYQAATGGPVLGSAVSLFLYALNAREQALGQTQETVG